MTHDETRRRTFFRIGDGFGKLAGSRAGKHAAKSHCNARQVSVPELEQRSTVLSSADEIADEGGRSDLHFRKFRAGAENGDEGASFAAAVVPGATLCWSPTANGAWGHFIGSGSELRDGDISGIFSRVVRGKLCGGAGAVVVVVGRE